MGAFCERRKARAGELPCPARDPLLSTNLGLRSRASPRQLFVQRCGGENTIARAIVLTMPVLSVEHAEKS
jgi:hypothetical protein